VKAEWRTPKWKLDASAVCNHFAAHRLVHPHISFAMRPIRLLVLPVFAVTLASCTNPRAEANMAQALNDAANEIGGLKSDIAQIQTDLDSLRSVVAKQDSVINRIAAANNIPR
jgi:septal ring factor EnvC (AmiA/AmiB activator)